MTDVRVVPVSLLRSMAEAIWETQWTSRWAAENIVCAYHCKFTPYKDQPGHEKTCEFVKLWAEIAELIQDTRRPVLL